MEFIEKMKKVQEKAEVVLKKVQKEMRRQTNRGKREIKEQKKGDKVILSFKDLVFRERLVKKLIKQYIRPYIVEKVISRNTIKLKLLAFIGIHLVVNVSRVVR